MGMLDVCMCVLIYVLDFHNLFEHTGVECDALYLLKWKTSHPKSQPDLTQTTIKLFFNVECQRDGGKWMMNQWICNASLHFTRYKSHVIRITFENME